jgi:hypothetical protein
MPKSILRQPTHKTKWTKSPASTKPTKTKAASSNNFGVIAYTKGARFTADEARAAVKAVLTKKALS